MKVLVTGGGGFLGRHIVEAMLKRGHGVRAMVRPHATVPSWSAEVSVVRADLRAPGDLLPALEGVDVVIHVAAATSGSEDAQFASTVVATENLIKAILASQTKRLVLISSFVLYDWDRASSVIDEETPTAQGIYELGGYTIAKVWQERVVREAAEANGLELTVLRPGFIWGEGHTEIAGMGRRFGRVFMMFGPFTRLPLIHVVNCADCVVAATENRRRSARPSTSSIATTSASGAMSANMCAVRGCGPSTCRCPMGWGSLSRNLRVGSAGGCSATKASYPRSSRQGDFALNSDR